MNQIARPVSGASVKLPLGLLLAALLSIVMLLLNNSAPSVRWEPAPLSWSGLSDSYAPASSSDSLTWRVSSGKRQRFQASFTPSGVVARPDSGDPTAWDWRMALTAYGYDGAMQAVGPTVASVNGLASEYQRGTLTEWYKNTPLGLEQGFTLSVPPTTGGVSASALRLDLSTSGSLDGTLSEGGDSVVFASPDGAVVLSYDSLHAFDAAGAELPSWMEYEAGRLSIFVDDNRAVYPITIDPIIATQSRLNASDPTADKAFGAAVARDGAQLIVGAWGDNQRGAGAGAAYIFVNNGTNWVQQAKLVASDGVAGDYFGYSVDINGGVAIVGAPGRSDTGFWAGAAYVFRWNGASWGQEAKLMPADLQATDQFGRAVAIRGSNVVVGAVGQNSAAGAAYVFTYSGGAWAQEAKLVASGASSGDSFGVSVAVNGNTAVIGTQGRSSSTGAAYVFGRSGGSWSQQSVLTAGDGVGGDLFGASVALNGSGVVVGAPFADASGQDSGAAYVFSTSSGAWAQEAKLVPTDAAASDTFGFSVAVDGDTAVVGSVDDDKGTNSGSAYIFERISGAWTEQGKLTASDGRAFDEFGRSVSIQGSTAIVGAHLADGATLADTGAVYVYNFQVVVNQPPTASAGGPYTVRAGASITLTGTASDPNGDTLAFEWDLDNDGSFETPGQTAVFSTAGKTPGTYTVSFRACDPSHACGVSAATVNVVPNNPPTASAGGPYTVAEGATVTLTGSGSDPDGDAVTYQWDLNYNGIFETPAVPSSIVNTAVFPPVDVSGVGPHNVKLQVCDIYNACTIAETVVTITNVTPTVNAGGPYSVVEGASITLTGTASDPGGGPLTYAWDLDNDGVFETSGQTAAFPPAGVSGIGPHTVKLRVCDSYGACAVAQTIVTIKEKPVLAALAYALLGIGKKSVRVGVQSAVSGGLVGGNGDVDTLNGSRVGDVLAGRSVVIGVKAVAGNIEAGDKVKVHKGAVTGTIVENASVPTVTLPAVNANPDKKKDIKRSQRDVKAGPLDLAPGRYGDLNSTVQDQIVLHGGEYHFISVSIDAKSKLRIDLSNGQPLVVRVAGNLKLGVRVQMEVVGGTAADIVFLVGGRETRLMEGGTYLGTFVAPNGKITLGVSAALNGAAWARRVQTLNRSVVTWAAFAHAELLGPAQPLQAHVGDVDDEDWDKDD